MEHSQLVQRAIQRLHDHIARRDWDDKIENLKIVLVEMATQKERADRLEKELAEVRMECAHQRCLAESRYTDWRKQLDKTEEMRRCFENEKATSASLEKLAEHSFSRDEAYLLLRALDYCLNPERDMIDLWEPHSEDQWKAVQAKVLAISKGCGCTETYPQLVPGKVSHGPGCPNRG